MWGKASFTGMVRQFGLPVGFQCCMQVFLDIVEEVNTLVSQKGEVLRSDVVGRMVMKAFLTGMPDVKIGLNDKVEVGACCMFCVSDGTFLLCCSRKGS